MVLKACEFELEDKAQVLSTQGASGTLGNGVESITTTMANDFRETLCFLWSSIYTWALESPRNKEGFHCRTSGSMLQKMLFIKFLLKPHFFVLYVVLCPNGP
jgi:hypothetical protein